MQLYPQLETALLPEVRAATHIIGMHRATSELVERGPRELAEVWIGGRVGKEG